MVKAYYVIQNSCKNLIRTSGMTITCVLILVLAFLSYFFLNLSSFLSYWHAYTIDEAMSTGSVGLVDLISPSGMLLVIFKYISLLIAVLFLINTISAIRRLFFQLANDQRPSFQTMSLIGETTEWISLEFALQAIYVSSTLLLSGLLIADFTFGKFLTDLLYAGAFEGIVGSYKLAPSIPLLVLSLSSLYIGIRVFLFVRKYLFSFFDNLSANFLSI